MAANINENQDAGSFSNTREEIAQSRDELLFAINAAELATWDLNPVTFKFSGNNRLKEWFGLNHDQDIDLELAINAIVEKDRQRVSAAIQQSMQFSSGGVYAIEYTIINRITGVERTVMAKGKALFNEDQIVTRFNGILQDITEEKVSRSALIDAEERARLAADAVDLGTYDMNLITGVMMTSERFDAIFGFDKKVNRSKFIGAIHPDDLSIRVNAHRRSVETGRLYYEVRVIWPNGEIHWIRVEGKIYYNDSIRPVRIIGTVLDISDRKFAEEELMEINKKLEVALQEQKELQQQKDDFIGIASHELKTPVTSIKAYTQVLTKIFNQKGDTREAGMMLKMDAQLNRLTSLIGDLLDVTKMNSGRLQFNDANFDFLAMLNFVIEDLQRTTERHTIIQDFENIFYHELA
ncbi:MAG: PAS domain S-box protein, partial [Chryseobacterium sp.]